MKKWIVASRLIIGMTPAVLAAEKFFVTVDTVGKHAEASAQAHAFDP